MINNHPVIIDNIECEKCPACSDIIFTHEQSIELDKKRINIEFGSKPILAPYQLISLRKILNVSLEDICELLHIGKNTYGRWERGEVAITPSMNLLVHNLIEKFPEAKVNLIETEMKRLIEKAKDHYLTDSVSLGEFVRQVMSATKILPDIICRKINITYQYLNQIQNNEIYPEKISVETSVNILKLFSLSLENMRRLLENSLNVYQIKSKVTFYHARKANYGEEGIASETRSINKIIEQYMNAEVPTIAKFTISEKYMKKVSDYMLKQESGR